MEECVPRLWYIGRAALPSTRSPHQSVQPGLTTGPASGAGAACGGSCVRGGCYGGAKGMMVVLVMMMMNIMVDMSLRGVTLYVSLPFDDI